MIAEPPGDFYAVPDELPEGEPGDIIWAQPIMAPPGALAWRVLYRSETISGVAIAVSGLVVAPDRPPPDDGFPVVAYAHGTTGLADQCAPSRATRPLGAAAGTGALPVPALWDSGFVVAATDYEGLGTPGRHPYMVGGSEARGVLDSVRAARQLPEAQAADQATILGISQGGHAALFAGEVAPAYAAELRINGVVALAPGAELAHAAFLLAEDRTAVGYAVAIGAGFEAAYPEARLERVLTRAALDALPVVDDGCMSDVLAAFDRPVREVLRLEALIEPPWPGLLEENTPGRHPTAAPIFVGQGTADPLVVPQLTDALVARLCATGNAVTYRRYLGAGHGSVADAAWADVRTFIGDRLAGRQAASDC
ncbi:MAG TPA: lipase family protein [Vitreimonas sp.]|nr:lipase family protein [Vitreimonas sp.]